MDKKKKNVFFMVAVDYIFKEGLVDSQKTLAEKIGISEAALSRIKNGTKTVSDETLRKMNAAFGSIFNMAYFRGESTKLLIEDVDYFLQHPEEDVYAVFDKELKNLAIQRNNNQVVSDDEVKKMKEQIAKFKSDLTNMQKIIDEKDRHITTLKHDNEWLRNLIDKMQLDSRKGLSDHNFQMSSLASEPTDATKM